MLLQPRWNVLPCGSYVRKESSFRVARHGIGRTQELVLLGPELGDQRIRLPLEQSCDDLACTCVLVEQDPARIMLLLDPQRFGPTEEEVTALRLKDLDPTGFPKSSVD